MTDIGTVIENLVKDFHGYWDQTGQAVYSLHINKTYNYTQVAQREYDLSRTQNQADGKVQISGWIMVKLSLCT